MKNKIIYSFLTLFIMVMPAVAKGYDMSVPLPGESIANDTLQFNVVKDIYPLTSKLNPVCLNHSITNTQIIHYPYDVVKKDNKYVKGYWKELWTVDYCGQKIQVPVTFKINKKSTDYIIENSLILK